MGGTSGVRNREGSAIEVTFRFASPPVREIDCVWLLLMEVRVGIRQGLDGIGESR